MKLLNVEIEWLGHSSFRINGRIYIDPFGVGGGKADIILVTHSHYDHYDEGSIRKLMKDGTAIIGPHDCNLANRKIIAGVAFTEKGIRIETVPAYNIGKPFHPKGLGVGYVIEIDGTRIYHAGDTDRIPGMQDIRADIALLPVGGKYTMNVEEAAGAAKDIRAKIVIPMHYGKLAETKADISKFKELVCPDVYIPT